MAVGDTHVFPGFLTPVLLQISFQSHQLLFSHALAEVRGEKYARKKFRLNRVSNSQLPVHESNTLTTEPCGQVTIVSTWIMLEKATSGMERKLYRALVKKKKKLTQGKHG